MFGRYRLSRRKHPLPNDGREVANDDEPISRVFGLADVGQHAVVAGGAFDPFEAGVLEIDFVQGRLTVTAAASTKEKAVKVKTRAPIPTPVTAFSGSGA